MRTAGANHHAFVRTHDEFNFHQSEYHISVDLISFDRPGWSGTNQFAVSELWFSVGPAENANDLHGGIVENTGFGFGFRYRHPDNVDDLQMRSAVSGMFESVAFPGMQVPGTIDFHVDATTFTIVLDGDTENAITGTHSLPAYATYNLMISHQTRNDTAERLTVINSVTVSGEAPPPPPPPPTEWAGYTILADDWVETGGLLGPLYIGLDPWIYAEALERWIFLPEENVVPGGAWWYAVNLEEEESNGDPPGPGQPVPGTDYTVRDKQWEDVFTQEIHDYYAPQFNTEVDYATVVYIDPAYTGGGSDGSIERPFTTLGSGRFDTSDVAYLVRRGTSHTIENIEFYGNDVMLGAYGEGDKPVLTDGRLIFRGRNGLIRDVDIDTVRSGTHGDFLNALNFKVFNARFHGTSENVFLGRNYKVIGVEVVNSNRNAIFIQQMDRSQDSHLEIGYCYIHKVNQIWFPDAKDQTVASGDGIMFSPFRGTYHYHNNIIYRSDTGNKFCIIGNAGDTQGGAVYGLIENNYLYAPHSYPSGGNGLYFGNIDGASAEAHHHIEIRNNVVVGTKHLIDGDENWTSWGVYTNSSRITAYGNLFIDMRGGLQLGSGAFGDNIVYNNTFINLKDRNRIHASAAYVYNNIFDEPASGSGVWENNLILFRVNLNTVFRDPANEDFRLVAGSPAIDGGTWQPWMNQAWTTDFLGTPVPHNDSIDIGAFQYRDEGDTEPPSVPQDLSASGVTATTVTLSWTESTDNVGVAGYWIYINGTDRQAVADTTASVTGLLPETEYTFTVTAFDAAGNESAPGDPLSVTTLPAPPRWAGFERFQENWADTGAWLGLVNVANAPWVYAMDLERWLLVPEEIVTQAGSWVFSPEADGD